MYRRGLTTAVILTLVVLASCANRRPASSLAPRWEHDAFSVGRPPNDHWYANVSDAVRNPDASLFRRDVPSPSRSFGFAVRMFELGREARSDLEFSLLVRPSALGKPDPSGTTITSYEARPEPRQGQFCLRFVMKTVDRSSRESPGSSFYSRMEGLYCRHSGWPAHAVVAAYVERGPVDAFDPALSSEGETLLQSFRLENVR